MVRAFVPHVRRTLHFWIEPCSTYDRRLLLQFHSPYGRTPTARWTMGAVRTWVMGTTRRMHMKMLRTCTNYGTASYGWCFAQKLCTWQAQHSALALFAQRTRIPTSARSIGFCAIWVCISSNSSYGTLRLISWHEKKRYRSEKLDKLCTWQAQLWHAALDILTWKKEMSFGKSGEVGHRSQYLAHAKRALYHLSYIPIYVFERKM